MKDAMLVWTGLIVGGFLLGSIMFSQLLPMWLLKKDICQEHEDQNPGAANVFASCGVVMGITCLCLDIFKGFLPVFAACRLVDTEALIFAAVIAAPVLGHAIAPLNHFRGGKCIATSFGVTLGLLPVSYVFLILAACYIFFSTVAKIPSHRQRSIAAFGAFGVLSGIAMLCSGQQSIAIGCAVVAVTAIVKHMKFLRPAEETRMEGKTADR